MREVQDHQAQGQSHGHLREPQAQAETRLKEGYSLANEVFTDALKRYDRSQSFDVFLYACLSNKIKSEMTRRNREKRKVKGCIISIDTPVGDDEDSTLKDVIADEFNMEQEIIRKQGERYSKRMLLYLGRLSLLQRKILHLEVIGYSPVEDRKSVV